MLLATAVLSFACGEDPDNPNPVPPVPDADFVLEVSDITLDTAHIKVQPKDKTMPYVIFINPASEYDKFASEEELISDDLVGFIELADEAGLTIEEWLEANLTKGDVEADQDMLRPGMEYVLYAYGLSTKGEATTKVYTCRFETPAVPTVDAKFKLEITSLTKTSAEVKAVADPSTTTFFLNIFDEEAYQAYGGDRGAFAAQVESLVSHYISMGASRKQIFDNLSSCGEDTFSRTDLLPGEKYYAFAIGIDKDFRVNSEPEVLELTTTDVTPSDNKLTVTIETISFSGFTATVEATNEDGYLWSVQPADMCDKLPSDEAIMWEVADIYKYNEVMDQFLTHGTTWLGDIDYLKPDTDYYLLVFGWDDAPTTPLVKVPVHTMSADDDPAALTVDIEIGELTHKSATVTTTGSSAVYYYSDIIEASVYDETLQAEGSVDAAVKKLMDASIEWGAEWFVCTKAEYLMETGIIGRQTYTYPDLLPQTDYRIYAMSVDMETGEAAAVKGFVSEVFTTPEHIISDASLAFVQGHHYDGDALAALDPDKYGDLAGMALLSYSVEPNATAAHWYTNFYAEDWSNESDDWIEMMLITFGYDSGNPDNVQYDKRSGVYVLPFDQTYSFVGMARDGAGILGHGVAVPITLSKADASPAEEFIASQSAVLRAPLKPAGFERRARRVRVGGDAEPFVRSASSESLPYAIEPMREKPFAGDPRMKF